MRPRLTRAPKATDLDVRLTGGATRMDQLSVLAEHMTPVSGVCASCRWHSTAAQRGCPSWAVARALRARRALPTWVAHLASAVPDAVVPVDRAAQRAAEDDMSGLFPAPARHAPPHNRRTSA